jgi:hypothetical protein
VAAGGLDLVCVPSFADIEIDGERRTAIRLIIEDRERRVIAHDAPLPEVPTPAAIEDLVVFESAPGWPSANGSTGP